MNKFQTITLAFGLFSIVLCCTATAQIIVDKTSLQSTYASKILRGCLSKNKEYKDFKINLKTDKNLPKEAYNLTINKKEITIAGGDERGVIYGTLGLVEDIKNGVLPTGLKNRTEKPQYPFRAIKYDLPWDSYRHSPALDVHIETCKDLKYWEKFLDMMVENRFNALTLWNLHPYTYMIKSKEYPEACPFTDGEMQEWQALFHGIFKMAEERGIDTYIFPFNIFVSPAFAKAHNVMLGNIEHNHISNSLPDTSSLVKNYTRSSIAQMLQEYPELDGMGITHGEMMGGMTPEEREDWLHATIIEGMRLAGRKVKLVHRIPLSADKTSGGSTSREAELITRKIIETEANLDFIEQPIWADMKYNWSHAHSTPKLIKVHGGKLYDGYFNPIPEKYKVTWTARNEDFLCLRWGVPNFVRAHITENQQAYTGGYFIGSETYIPAKDYFTKNTEGVNWQYAFERQWLFYKIWGRLLYNPQTPDAVFEAEFIRKFGKNGKNLLQANALAGKTPLILASSFDCTWDFTLYSEGFLARNPKTNNVDYITVDRQINQPPLDHDYVSVKDYVQKTLENKGFEKSKITPPMMAETLQNSCNKALELVKNIDVSKDKTLMYEVADIRIWANLGLYFSEKTRGAVALQMYRKQGGEANKTLAIKHLEKALKYWDEVVEISQPIYNEMPLVHFSEQKNMTKEQFNKQRFHWLIIRTDVAYDIEIAKNAEVDIAIKKLLYSDDFTAAYDTTKWFAELGTNHNSTVSVKNGAMEIDVDYGATVWFKNELKDAWMVEFDRTVPMKGGKNDRLSDFNVFWQATDPHTGKLLGRDPDFKNYDTLSLYYVGMGGNRNTTTRFRKYMGTSSKDVIQEYTDAEHLIEADKIYHCRIVFKKDTTSFYINDALFFTYKDAQPLTHGYFGFRTLRSRQVIDNFKVFEIE